MNINKIYNKTIANNNEATKLKIIVVDIIFELLQKFKLT